MACQVGYKVRANPYNASLEAPTATRLQMLEELQSNGFKTSMQD